MMDGVSDQPDAAPDAASATANRVRLLAAIAVAVLVADIITKTIAVAQLEGREPVRILGGLIYLQLLRNPGAAFSMATGFTWILSVIASNLMDRIFRAPGPLQGHVVDMVSPFAPNGEAFAVFNLADSAISCGGVLLVVLALFGYELDGSHDHDRKTADG